MKELLSNWKVKVSMIGGAVVIATAYGTCTIDPDEEAIKGKVEEAIESKKEEVAKPDVAEPAEKEEK